MEKYDSIFEEKIESYNEAVRQLKKRIGGDMDIRGNLEDFSHGCNLVSECAFDLTRYFRDLHEHCEEPGEPLKRAAKMWSNYGGFGFHMFAKMQVLKLIVLRNSTVLKRRTRADLVDRFAPKL